MWWIVFRQDSLGKHKATAVSAPGELVSEWFETFEDARAALPSRYEWDMPFHRPFRADSEEEAKRIAAEFI